MTWRTTSARRYHRIRVLAARHALYARVSRIHDVDYAAHVGTIGPTAAVHEFLFVRVTARQQLLAVITEPRHLGR